MGSPYERDGYFGIPLESQTTGPQTTNLPLLLEGELPNCRGFSPHEIERSYPQDSQILKGDT